MGQAISWLERDPICHIAVDMHDGWAVAEEPQGCWARPIEAYGSGVLRYSLALEPAGETAARTWLRQQVGRGYNYPQIICDAVHLTGIPFSNAVDGKYVCSSLAAVAAQRGGLQLFDKPAEAVTPADWHHLYLARKEDHDDTTSGLAAA